MDPTRARLVIIVGVVLVLLATFALLWPGLRPGPPPGITLEPDDPALVAEGKRIYEAECAVCHGAELEGQPDWRTRRPDGMLPAPPHDPTGHTWHHPDPVLFALTKYGPAKVIGDPAYKSEMPAYDEVLSDDEIIAVLSYIKSTWPAPIRERHDRLNADARRD